ncbi:MAG TPA: GntR family transcriptional regulator [Thermoanaerobaculia bacterium]|nr:GntR family transcriptional regulator [Thermoanaerobaculia bacterium]
MLHIDPSDATPIWRQIEEGVRNLVVTGALGAGGPVPSVRELARELAVNPATVSKAYQRLTEAGILEVRRGEGTFVAAAPPALAPAERRRLLEGAARALAVRALSLGAGADEAEAALRHAFAAFGDGDSKEGEVA